MKKIFLMLLIACFSVGVANAQFGKLKGLAKKAKQAVEQVDKSKAKAEKAQQSSTVVQEVKKAKETQTEVAAPVETQVKKNSLESYEKRLDDGRIVFVGDDLGMYAKAEKNNWEDVQKIVYDPKEWVANTTVVEKNALYYLYRWKKACDEGDTEKMTGEIYPRVNWCVNQIANYNSNERYGMSYIKFKPFAKDYNATVAKFKEIIWAGKPSVTKGYKELKTQADFDNYAKENFAIWNHVMDKADEAKAAGKPITQQFYLNTMVGQRETMLCFNYLKGDEKGFAEFDNRLKNALKDTPDDFQKNNVVKTPQECRDLQAAREKQWAKEKAEKEAARLAEIESKTEDWPKSNMPELDAQILRIVRAKFPDRKITRVSVMNNKWNVMMKGLVPERRVVQFWMEYYHKEAGRVIAEEHYVCQYYNGTYGKTQYQSQGARYFWVRQK